MLQPRLCLRQFLSIRRSIPYTSSRTYAEAVDTVPPAPVKATSTVAENTYEAAERPEDTVEPAFVLRSYKPRTPGVRHLRRPINDHLYKGRPFRPLTIARKGQHIGGRNNSGKITVRHRGNGAKRRIRTVDFFRLEPGKHTVERIEYDPGRTAHIALVTNNATARKSYIIAAQGMRAGEQVESYRQGIPQALLDSLGGSTDAGMIASKTAWRGNCLPLHMIPAGTLVYNVGLKKGGKAQLCRSAGTFAMVIGSKTDEESDVKNDGEGVGTPDPRDGLWVNVKLKSGEVRRIHKDACATIGTASNSNWNRRQLGKAGRSRWLGIRPTVRGMAMNANEHPHGGGRGKSKGNVKSQSIWGQLTKSNYKTRDKRKINRFVVKARPRGVDIRPTKPKRKERKKAKN